MLGLIALARFGWGARSEPHFMDESAYLAQSFYWDLFRDGERDSWLWLAYDGQDLPPLTKYLVGISLELHGLPRPGPASSMAWYRDPGIRVGSEADLLAGRLPVACFGALGIAATYWLGSLAFSRRAGVLGALLLLINPLYALHAARAMSDVPAESLLVASVACGLWAWGVSWREGVGWRWWAGILGAGVLGGLATLSKLNGALAIIALGAIGIPALVLATRSGSHGRWGRAAWLGVPIGLAMSGLIAVAIFIALNPFVTAQPTGRPPAILASDARPGESWIARLGHAARHRAGVARVAQGSFPHNAVDTIPEKGATVFVQGWGRFGPFGPRWSDSKKWLDPAQDWGMLPWGGIVIFGVIVAVRAGAAQLGGGEAPTAWGVLVYAMLAFVAVGAYIPLAWDRYLMSIQPPSAILGAVALDRIWRWARGGGDGAA